MSNAYKIGDQYARYFLTLTVVDWIDVFSRERYRKILLESLHFSMLQKGLVLYAYVIMTNHVHLILSSSTGQLSSTLRELKSFTARRILKTIATQPESRRKWLFNRFGMATKGKIGVQHQFWQHDNHAILLYTPRFVRQKCQYIHNNPVRAGFVSRASDWLYSSAANYEGEAGLIEVRLLEEMYFF